MEQPEKGSLSDLVYYRIETAKSDLQAAKILLKEGEYRGANNRAYYAIYHAISAIHALDGKSYKRHKDTLANFNKEYIKTEIFPITFGRRIARAEEIRHAEICRVCAGEDDLMNIVDIIRNVHINSPYWG